MRDWRTACPGWEARLLAGQSLVPDLPLFRTEADRAVRVFDRLRIPDVPGKPRFKEAIGDWFRDIVAALFGSYDARRNVRMIQEVFLLVSKKNSKSTGAAGIMVTAAIMCRRPEAELVLIAPTKVIADISFRQASGMIKADPKLATLFHLQRNTRTITHRVSGVTIQIKAADTDTITGGKQYGTLVDETHVFAAKAKAADIFIEARGALAAHPDGFLIQITTQSKDPPAGVFKSELAKARDVRDGKLDRPILPVLYEFPKHMAQGGTWKERRYWPLVNPNLGRSVSEDFLARELATAEREGPGQLALFASQHFNVEIGLALRSDRWPGAEHWQKRADPKLTLEAVLERSEVVVIGIDGGGLDDLFGLVVLGRAKAPASRQPAGDDAEGGAADAAELLRRQWFAWGHAWCHKGVLERRQSIAPTLLDFEKAGELTIVGDELEDISAIIEIVRQVNDRGLLASVAVDPAGIGELVDALAAIGVTQEGKQVVGAPQGYAMMNAIKTAERKLANGTLWHSGSGLMAWAVGNLKIEPTATAIRATKQHAGDAKIDPVMALFDAVTVMSTNPEPPAWARASPWEDEAYQYQG
jgi:phage terminase large subunit-like protein